MTDVPDTDATLTLPETPEGVTSSERAREDRRLLRRYHGQGEVAARDELVERFLPLARQLARRYQRGNEPLDDLVQVASIGLVKAVDRFDPERGTAFSSYAVPTILGELKRYFRDAGWAVHVPRGMQERVMTVNQAVGKLSRELGRSPTAGEIAAEIDEDPEDVLEALEAAIAYDAVSLDTPRTSEEEDGDTYANTVGVIDERFELVEYKSAIGPTMKALPARDRLVLKLRFEEDLTQLEIAQRIGVSQMHVSRLIRRALKRLRTVAEAQEPPAAPLVGQPAARDARRARRAFAEPGLRADNRPTGRTPPGSPANLARNHNVWFSRSWEQSR
jgi:RNA polymerase sigma-B factor